MMAISPASAVGTPTTTHRGGRPEGPPGGPAGGGRPAGLGGVQDLSPYGPVTGPPPGGQVQWSGQQLDRAGESEAEGLLDGDVQEARLLQLLRPAERADVDGPEPPVGSEPGDRLFRGVVVPGDEHVQRLAVHLTGDQRRGERRVE